MRIFSELDCGNVKTIGHDALFAVRDALRNIPDNLNDYKLGVMVHIRGAN